MWNIYKTIKKEAYIIPVILSLFLVPLFWNPLFINSFTQGKEILFKSIIIITFFLCVIGMVIKGKKELKLKNILESHLFLLLFAEIIFYAISNSVSQHPIVTLYGTYTRGFGFIMELFLFAFILYVALVITEKRTILLLKVVFVSGLVLAAYGIFQKIGINPFFNTFDINIFAGRSFSFLGNPSYLGQYMSLLLITGAFLFLHEVKWKYFYLIGSIVFIITLLFSGTRTALVGMFLASILVFMKYYKTIFELCKKYKHWLFGAVLVIAVVLGVFYSKIPDNRFSISASAFRSFESRVEIWKGTLGLIKENPVFGHGAETFYIYFPDIVTKKFLMLEENINTSADRVHNELLQVAFDHGILGAIIYLVIFVYLIRLFFKSTNPLVAISSLAVVIYMIQNQLGFPDITQNIFIGFCIGGIISVEAGNQVLKIRFNRIGRFSLAILATGLLVFFAIQGAWKPYMSQRNFYESKMQYSKDYEKAINYHKSAISYTPYYSELWYELMFIDPSSMERAIAFLEKIDGNSGNLLAWKGNLYSTSNPDLAAKFYLEALKRNPNHPNWIRAFADMLYANGDLESALFMYNEYLNAIPAFWETKTEKQDLNTKKKYETLTKTTPNFEGTIKRMEEIIRILENKG